MPDITYDVGRVSFVMKGAWNLATAYEKLDAVTYDGSLYIAKQDVPGGTAITNTTYWQLAAEKGDQGETGNGIASIAKTGTAGNVDTYTITYTDGTTTTFTVTNGGVTTVNGRTGDVTGLAEEDGSYPLLNAGTADNLTPYSEDSGATQSIPFIAQGTGCGNGESVVDTGSYLQFKKKLGNTVGVNQLCPALESGNWASEAGVTASYSNGVLTYSTATGNNGIYSSSVQSAPPAGHKYLIAFTGSATASAYLRVGFPSATGVLTQTAVTTTKTRYSAIFTSNGATGNTRIYLYSANTGVTFTIEGIEIRDLTLWFGSNDRIPSDLLSHPENWGRYYAGSLAYAAGYLDSADGTVLKSIGRNVWDEVWENGYYDTDTGAPVAYAGRIRSKKPIYVIPSAEMYCYSKDNARIAILGYDGADNYIGLLRDNVNGSFSVPSNCSYIRFYASSIYGGTYKNDITISLYYSGESGYDQYYPYSVLAEVDTGSEVLRSAGAIADEKTPDGTIMRRVGVVDLGTLTWAYDGRFYAPLPLAEPTQGKTEVNGACGRYVWGNNYNTAPDKSFFISSTKNLSIWDSAYTDAATFKTAMSGVYLYYELATPTTEQGTAFAENIPCDDFGSMYWTQTKGIPQGNEIFYPVDYKASIDTLYNRVDGDMGKIVTEDEYPEAPSSDGTYVLKATVSGGTKTYAWVAE